MIDSLSESMYTGWSAHNGILDKGEQTWNDLDPQPKKNKKQNKTTTSSVWLHGSSSFGFLF